MTPEIKNLDIYVSPQTHKPLELSEDGSSLVTADGSERFPIKDGVVYLLPEKILNQDVKAEEREGWKKVFESHQWIPDPQWILKLPETKEDPYWEKVDTSFQYLKPLLGDLKGKRGLDLACGLGWATSKFAQWGASMTAGDFNDTIYNGLSAAIKVRKHGVYFDAVCCDSETLPIADNSLDFAFICSALHHFTEPVKALKEIYRVLKPGGQFIDICESFIPTFGSSGSAHSEVFDEYHDEGINEQEFTQGQYEKMFREAGFDEVVTLLPCWDGPVENTPAKEWINNKAVQPDPDHPRTLRRFLFQYARFTGLPHLMRLRLLHLKTMDRLFVATKKH